MAEPGTQEDLLENLEAVLDSVAALMTELRLKHQVTVAFNMETDATTGRTRVGKFEAMAPVEWKKSGRGKGN